MILVEARSVLFLFFVEDEDGVRDATVTGVQTCALPIFDRAELRKLCRTVGVVAIPTTPPTVRHSLRISARSSPRIAAIAPTPSEIGRASCRKRACNAVTRRSDAEICIADTRCASEYPRR